MELFVFIFAALFSVINPLGTLPVFVGLTQHETKGDRSKIAFWTSINTLIILLVAFFLGRYVLSFFGISLSSLRLAGGLIISSSGFALLTGSFMKHKGINRKVKADAKQRSDISLTPLAIPMLAGPGSISLLIGFRQQYDTSAEQVFAVFAILSVCLLVYFMLKSAPLIVRLLGASGLNAVSRIIGFIVIAIGMEYITQAIIEIHHVHFA